MGDAVFGRFLTAGHIGEMLAVVVVVVVVAAVAIVSVLTEIERKGEN